MRNLESLRRLPTHDRLFLSCATNISMMRTSNLFLLLCYVSLSLVESQVPVPMGVCHFAELSTQEVQSFCQNVPDCMYTEADPSDLECYMRCHSDEALADFENDDEGEVFQCEDYGMTCHEEVMCVLPIVLMKDGDD